VYLQEDKCSGHVNSKRKYKHSSQGISAFLFQIISINIIFLHYLLCIFQNDTVLVGIVTGYRLENKGPHADRSWNFFLNHNVHTGSGTHPASYQMGNMVSFPGELLDHEADHLPSISDEFQ
jgi:hypothetical protein